ncbi:MAG: hypothetical protein EBU90_18140 [Proteobacteria bacterium]|nr:hypothetical protein [Pseudomonadota bacterium]NBP14619.1 hypothetical protein [bacterium]
MPAQSQSLTFTVNSTSTVSVNYPNTGTGALTLLSNKVKGDGYFSGSDGNHTVQVQITNFVGRLEIHASLSSQPESTDWFSVPIISQQAVDTTGAIITANTTTVSYNLATTNIKSYNFIGNFVWVRGKISQFTEGTVNSIKLNY